MYLKDEISTWYALSRKANVPEAQLREHVMQNVDLVVRRTLGVSCKAEREKMTERVEPVYQTILDLTSQAVNPLKLAQMDVGFLAQL